MSPSWPASHLVTLGVFGLVYLGMILGGLPRLSLDRTGIALLGAITVVGAGVLTPEEAAAAVHLPTILLLFAFMVLSAQMRLGGFYSAITRRIAGPSLSPPQLMGAVVAASGALSAVFSNDIVCLAMAPVLADACLRRRVDPVPYLLALAAASNIGSAATLIGNPQNMLVGQVLALPFATYTRHALPPVVLGLAGLWALLTREVRTHEAAPAAPPPASGTVEPPPFDRWQTAKGLAVAFALMAIFLASDWPRDVAALVGAGVLLLSQRFHSSTVMGLIDWQLLVLFMGLFVVNHAMALTGLAPAALDWLGAHGVALGEPGALAASTAILSNLVSNVPAVMLLLPAAKAAARPEAAGELLALVSTFAGNLVVVGSIANIIVVDAARKAGIDIDWRRHARIGVPVTLATLTVTVLWLAL
ncbi:MAG: anion transporter [Vicinamibacterales bacterium]